MPSRKARRPAGSKRALVTGAGGFLGGHICRYLGSRGYEIAAVGRFHAPLEIATAFPNLAVLGGMTLPDPAFASLVARFQPELLVHCAGTSSVAGSVREPYADFQRTVDVCAFALETVRRNAPACRFIHLSSASVYGEPRKLPIDESAPCSPISPYGFHKRMCETLVEEYGTLFGVRVSILRIFSAYGENLARQVVHDLCGKILAAGSGRFEVIGTGRESRDFIHAEDVAQAVEKVFAAGADGIFNLGSGAETSIRSLLDLLRRELASDAGPAFTKVNRKGDPLNWRADISKLAALGFAPAVGLEAGIRRYCRWYREAAARPPSLDWTGIPSAAPAKP